MSIWTTRPNLAVLNEMGSKCLVGHLGIEMVGFSDDGLTARMPVDQRTHQPMGILHGGASVVLAETIGSVASHLVVNPLESYAVGLDISATHIRSVRSGWVYAKVKPIHLGKTVHVWDIRIHNEEGKPTCVSRLTMSVRPLSSLKS